MAEKLVIIILNSDPQNNAEILEPVYHATIAASMDYSAEIILAGRAGELAIRGVADKIESGRKAGETLYDLLKEAYQSGVVIKASKFVGEIMNTNVKTLSY